MNIPKKKCPFQSKLFLVTIDFLEIFRISLGTCPTLPPYRFLSLKFWLVLRLPLMGQCFRFKGTVHNNEIELFVGSPTYLTVCFDGILMRWSLTMMNRHEFHHRIHRSNAKTHSWLHNTLCIERHFTWDLYRAKSTVKFGKTAEKSFRGLWPLCFSLRWHQPPA